MDMRSQMRRIEPEILLHRLTPINRSISNNIRLIPRRTKPSSILDTIRSRILQHTIQKSVCVEKCNSRVWILLLEFGGGRGEDGVELVYHVCVWEWVALQDVFGGFV